MTTAKITAVVVALALETTLLVPPWHPPAAVARGCPPPWLRLPRTARPLQPCGHEQLGILSAHHCRCPKVTIKFNLMPWSSTEMAFSPTLTHPFPISTE